jgi:hypothetical protein
LVDCEDPSAVRQSELYVVVVVLGLLEES